MYNHELFGSLVPKRHDANLAEALTPAAVLEKGLCTYWAAEFAFPTCPAYRRGVIEAAEAGRFGFTIQDDYYNERVQWWLKTVRGVEIEKDWIVPTQGTIFGIATSIRLFVKPGQNMIVILPGYSRYKQACDRMNLGCVSTMMKYENAGTPEARYMIDFDDLERKMADPANTLLILCQPNNPTGSACTQEELARIARLSEKYGVAVYSDEIFGEVSHTGAPIPSFISVCTEETPAIVCTSLGKCMSLTGVNHANVIIRSEALREKYRAQRNADHYGSIDPCVYAGMTAAMSEEGAAFVRELEQLTKHNTALMTEALEALPGVHVVRPQGSYILWADFTGLGLSDEDLRRLLEEEALFFGGEGSDYGVSDQFRRYCVTVPPQELEKSLALLHETCRAKGII